MDEKIFTIKKALGTGSINIFGRPMSGKDTVGQKLAEKLGAEFLSSGEIIRSAETRNLALHSTADGKLTPTNMFYEIVLPEFKRSEYQNMPLVLSSIGRWHGEEEPVRSALIEAGHELKVVVYLDLSEEEVLERWQTAQKLNDRGERADDQDPKIFKTRLEEFKNKTMPVLNYYQEQGLLVRVKATGTREEVFLETIEEIAKKLVSPVLA